MSNLNKKEFYEKIIKAQQNDCESNYENAFLLYLEGINGLSDYLIRETINRFETIGNTSIDSKIVNGVNTLKNCVERLQIITNYSLNTNQTYNQINDSKVMFQPINSVTSFESNTETSDGCIGHITNGMKTLSPVPKSSALEKAYKENAFLTKIFEHRFKTTADPSKRANLVLEFQRRITENIELAKAKDKEEYHEMHLRERKALEEAAKKLIQQQNALNLDNESMIVDNQSQQQLYAQILQFESKNLSQVKQYRCHNLSPDLRTVNEIISKILHNADHPLAKWVRKFQFQINNIIDPLLKQYVKYRSIDEEKNLLTDESEGSNRSLDSRINTDLLQRMEININKLELEALERHFNNITTDISLSHETITLMLTLIMFDDQLYYNRPSNCEQLRDQHFSLHSIIADYFYPPIWSPIYQLFRIIYYEQEEDLEKGMQDLFLINDLEKQLSEKFDKTIIDETAVSLRNIIQLQSPYAMLKSMVRLTQKLCNQLKTDGNYCEVSADELVPALCHIVVKTVSPQLITECYAIEQLVDQKYLLGEEGYCLSSIMTALKYIQINGKTPSEENTRI